MKKMIGFGAVALCAAVACADVTSANVVGYSSVEIKSKWTCIGVNFQDIEGGSLKLNEAIPYQEGMTASNNYALADQIQIGDDSGNWTTYYMSNGYNMKNPPKPVAGLEHKWSLAGKFAVADAELKPGYCFWYWRADATKPSFTLSVAGSVTMLESVDFDFKSTWRCFSNPYPVPLKLNEAFPYDVATMTASNNYALADQIQIGDTSGNWTTYYLSNGYNMKNPPKPVAGLEGKWSLAGKFADADAEIPVGRAAWYKRADASKPAVKMHLEKPYNL